MVHTLLVNYLTTLPYEKTKEEVKEKLTHTVGVYYKEEVENDLDMRVTMDELLHPNCFIRNY